MPRARKKQEEEAPLDAEEATKARDFVMARLAAGRAAAQSAINLIDEAVLHFVDPEEDEDGEERVGIVEEALEWLGTATRSLEAVEEEIENIDPTEVEPWEEVSS